MNNKKPNLDLAYALETVQDNRELYASWATDYDKDFASSMDYILPNQVAQIFLNMGGIGPVLDVGAGTGLGGQALAKLGIDPIDALDLSDEMLEIANKILPEDCCLVPEKRQELTTEGGLDVLSQLGRIKEVCSELSANNIKASLFIDPDNYQIEAAVECGAPIIEIHTGHYADASSAAEMQKELQKISEACAYAHSLGLQVNAGHGLTLENTKAIAEINSVVELNIGHSIISRALFVGLGAATSEMKQLIQEARGL